MDIQQFSQAFFVEDEDGQVVADHVRAVLHQLRKAEVEVDAALAQRGPQHRRMARWMQHVAARIVQRQAQAERAAVAHFGHALPHLLRRDQVQPTQLVVRAEVSPGGAGRAQLADQAVLEQQRSIFRRVSRFTPTVGLVTHVDTAILLVYGGYLVVQHALTLGDGCNLMQTGRGIQN